MFCSEDVATDAGQSRVRWMCPPGTYICLSPGRCAQCLSDSDCANGDLPTYEPSRQHCDLDSGVPGYQNFCQVCVQNADCADAGIDDQCDLNPSFAQASVEMQGFETCANLGPGCLYGTKPAIGPRCASYSCTTDADCADAVSNWYAGTTSQEAEPFCVNGTCDTPANSPSFCPNCFCTNQDTTCEANAVCDTLTDHCGCTSSGQCGGAWPICEFPDAGSTRDGGIMIGSCGCGSDTDCGDGGLRCLNLPPGNMTYGGPACLFDCRDPRFPGCASLVASTPICDQSSGLCVQCQVDEQCRNDATGLFVGPYCRYDGSCGCKVNSDCSDNEVCAGPFEESSDRSASLGQCSPPKLSCTRESCDNGGHCEPDSGTCLPSCLTDFECGGYGFFCDQDAGTCIQCRDSADCAASGQAAKGNSACVQGECYDQCATDLDCAGNPNGSRCDHGFVMPSCVECLSDPDCAGSPQGPHCQDATCTCRSTAECGPGETCPTDAGDPRCSGQCQVDGDCPAAFFCDLGQCRPRCDDGGAGCRAPDPVCDEGNLHGDNGYDGV